MATVLKPSVTVSAKVKKQLEEFAQAVGGSETEIADEAIANYIRYHSRMIAKVEEGRTAARRGELVDNEAVGAWLQSWGTENELPPPFAKKATD